MLPFPSELSEASDRSFLPSSEFLNARESRDVFMSPGEDFVHPQYKEE